MSHSPLEFDQTEPRDGLDIAIVGMAARFPGAPDLEAFWRNLCAGVESVSRLTPQELAEAGVDRVVAEELESVAVPAEITDFWTPLARSMALARSCTVAVGVAVVPK